MIQVILGLFLYANVSQAIDIIPYDKNSWTRFEQIRSMNIKVPVLINKKVNGIGVINEEIKPKIAGESAEKNCLDLKGHMEKKYCRLQTKENVSFIFSKEFKKGFFYQSISFAKKDIQAIKTFETGLK
jgi:hypothetical protein